MCLPSHALSVLQNAEGRLVAQSRRHAKGIYHGDINRFNILGTPENEIVAIGFENSTLLAVSGRTEKKGWYSVPGGRAKAFFSRFKQPWETTRRVGVGDLGLRGFDTVDETSTVSRAYDAVVKASSCSFSSCGRIQLDHREGGTTPTDEMWSTKNTTTNLP